MIGDAKGQIMVYSGNSSLSLVYSFKGHLDVIYRIKQTPFHFKSASNYIATCSNDRTIKIWNVSSLSSNWTLITEYSHLKPVYSLEWLDDDTLASAGLTEKTINIWSATTGQTNRTINVTNGNVYSLTLLNTKINLAAGLSNGNINIYNINDGNLVSSLKGHTLGVNDLVKMSDDLLASSSNDDTVRIWNLTTNACKFILKGHTDSVMALKQITSNILASGSYDATIKLWDTTSGQEIGTLLGPVDRIYYSLDLLNSQTLASGSFDGVINLCDWSTTVLCTYTKRTSSKITSLSVININ